MHLLRYKCYYSINDVPCVDCNVLHTGSPIEVNVLLYLALPCPWGRLVEWHLDGLVPVGHHDGTQGTVLSVHLREK